MASRAIKIDPKKAAASGLKTQGATTQITETSIVAVRAYELWIQRGCPIGTPEIDWFQAEKELRGSIA
jgi:hypothetical protein